VHTTPNGVADVSGVATVEGYTVDSLGDNETAAFFEALADLLNIQAADISVFGVCGVPRLSGIVSSVM